MAVSSRQKLTYEEWLDFPIEEGLRAELIDGEVCMAPQPTLRHQEILVRLLATFHNYLKEHGGGRVYIEPNFKLAEDQGFAPDLVFVRDTPTDRLTIDGPADLVVEIVSDERRDLRIKRDRYERYGVPEYWAVLPEGEQVLVFRLGDDGRYDQATVFEGPVGLSPLALPELVIDLGEIFAA